MRHMTKIEAKQYLEGIYWEFIEEGLTWSDFDILEYLDNERAVRYMEAYKIVRSNRSLQEINVDVIPETEAHV